MITILDAIMAAIGAVAEGAFMAMSAIIHLLLAAFGIQGA